MVYDLDGVARADLLTAVNDAAAAGGRHEDAADGAFVAGDVDHLDDVGVVFVPAQGELDALLHDGALFEDAAAHRGFRPGGDLFGNIYVNIVVAVFVFVADDGFEHIVFEFLYGGVKNPLAFGHCHILRYKFYVKESSVFFGIRQS